MRCIAVDSSNVYFVGGRTNSSIPQCLLTKFDKATGDWIADLGENDIRFNSLSLINRFNIVCDSGLNALFVIGRTPSSPTRVMVARYNASTLVRDWIVTVIADSYSQNTFGFGIYQDTNYVYTQSSTNDGDDDFSNIFKIRKSDGVITIIKSSASAQPQAVNDLLIYGGYLYLLSNTRLSKHDLSNIWGTVSWVRTGLYSVCYSMDSDSSGIYVVGKFLPEPPLPVGRITKCSHVDGSILWSVDSPAPPVPTGWVKYFTIRVGVTEIWVGGATYRGVGQLNPYQAIVHKYDKTTGAFLEEKLITSGTGNNNITPMEVRDLLVDGSDLYIGGTMKDGSVPAYATFWFMQKNWP